MNITIGSAVLMEFGRFMIEESKRQFEQSIADEKAEALFSPKVTAESLDVNLSTLWRWNKIGYLSPVEVGGKRKYRKSDIDKILKKGETA